MDGEVSAQVASPIFLHQGLPGRFHEVPALARKRDLSWQGPNVNQQSPPQSQQRLMSSGYPNVQSNWNPKSWAWDSTAFIARPASDASEGALRLATPSKISEMDQQQKKNGEESVQDVTSVAPPEEEESLTLKLGGRSYATEEPAVRPNKRVRSGSPGNVGNYPTCQVDDCKTDLSNAKDYHRRHKVCEVHSKTTKAMVGNQMQRFCQQCSRFHLLSEFDEGKRSCRRRLAGHNRRRRKTQAEDASSRLLLPPNRANTGGGNLDIVNLLAILARLQGRCGELNGNSSLPDKDGLVHILNKINALPGLNSSATVPKTGGFDLNVSQASEDIEHHPNTDASAMDLLAVLSAALKASGANKAAALSQGSSDGSADDKTKINSLERAADVNSQSKIPRFSPISVDTSVAPRPSTDVAEHPVEEARPSLQLQLFSSTEEDSPPKIGSCRRYLSSESSNPMEDGSHSSSPPIERRLFPLQSGTEALRLVGTSTCRENNGTVDAVANRDWRVPLERFKDAERRVGSRAISTLPHQAGYTSSSSGSDHSPSSSHSDVQDRTGRIIFKLFDKDPSNFPPSLRTEILAWLSHSPSEIESYIRPGCVVLSIYLAMPSFAWEELHEEFLQRVSALVQRGDSDLWKTGRFLVHTDRQLASHKDGKIHLSKSWRSWSAPELICVSPLAVVGGEETSVVLRGRNLTSPGTRVHCTFMGGYSSKELASSHSPSATVCDDSGVESFSFPGGSPNVFGRCFIEVENGLKGNNFPLIIADGTICRELRLLEPDVEVDLRADAEARPRSREDCLHFLNELGWLFQRRQSCPPRLGDFSSSRFKFLFVFSVERDFSATVGKLLDILVEKCRGDDGAIQQSLEMLSEIQLLHRAVKRKCRKMVDLLLHYSVDGATDGKRFFLFPPDLKGPGGLSPLHLAASMQDSADIVDALTDDPQEKGLTCWASSVDDNGESPHGYAAMRNNHAYNRLVAVKIADRRNAQVSITIVNGEGAAPARSWAAMEVGKPPAAARSSSCARCAMGERVRIRSTLRPQGLLQRPYVHSMLAIAAVCVCVCLFLRGAPELGSVAPFKWETLGVGTM